MPISFKKKSVITNPHKLKYGQWYQCSCANIIGNFLLRQIADNTFFVIYDDMSSGTLQASIMCLWTEFEAFYVELDIKVL